MHGVLPRACDAHLARLEGLAQRLEGIAPELRQLIEEEHPAVGEGHLPGAGVAASPDQAREAGRVVRGAQGTPVPLGAGAARVRVRECQELQLLLGREPGEQAREALREHGLPHPWGSSQEQAVPSRRRDHQRALAELLSPHVVEPEVLGLGAVRAGGLNPAPGARIRRLQGMHAPEVIEGLAEVREAQHLHPWDEPQQREAAHGCEDRAEPRAAGGEGGGEDPGRGVDRAAEVDLAQQQQVAQARRGDLPQRAGHGDRDPQVGQSSLLGARGGGEVQVQLPLGQAQPRAGEDCRQARA